MCHQSKLAEGISSSFSVHTFFKENAYLDEYIWAMIDTADRDERGIGIHQCVILSDFVNWDHLACLGLFGVL